ncbi:MoaD/ThiS family protein [Methylotuvimicrobium alcaliphilum]|uniref:ThiamineS protein n=1 Tax=Methylotuvimicrobium alcaliphilum (strain DSM 19304 / NCIMB 14124 / VKM B-2133 / 20Z) TaxID=1091494 RepID=G4T242_META2|nr:MoaD/ThiS family protein [Methylotuvimicrobium alcaliphilum]CCE22468.1 conserved protein of unknown function [Methylotuvimicrobium alcaliphilum 20Z]
MKITVKLFAGLRRYLPTGTTSEGLIMALSEAESPHQVLERFNLPRNQVHLLLINGIFIEPVDRDRPILKEGDVLAVWPPVAGG